MVLYVPIKMLYVCGLERHGPAQTEPHEGLGIYLNIAKASWTFNSEGFATTGVVHIWGDQVSLLAAASASISNLTGGDRNLAGWTRIPPFLFGCP